MRTAFLRCAARVVTMILFAALLYDPSPALATLLGSAQSFAILAGSTVTTTGTTTITGDIGVWEGTAFTVSGTFTHTGTQHLGDAVAQTAQGDLNTAYNTVAGLAVNTVLTGQDLGGMTLTPGVYFFASSAGLTGTLTLDAENNPTALFAFRIGTTLITDSSSVVSVINATSGTGVFWQVGSSATLGSSSVFRGNILADQSISFDPSATLPCGRALARIGAVTLSSNTVSNDCTAGGYSGGGIDPIPEPGSVTLIGIGLLSLIVFGWRSRTRVA